MFEERDGNVFARVRAGTVLEKERRERAGCRSRRAVSPTLLPAVLVSFLVAGLVVGSLSGCAGDEAERPVLQVYAASSLTEAFDEVATAFETGHPGTRVLLTFAGSQVLRLQIEQGAAADVFASANPAHMRALVEASIVDEAQVFAHNELVVIVPPDNPARIETFRNLVRASRLVIGTENVPVGRYTRTMLARAGAVLGPAFESEVLTRVVSEEGNVRLVRSKVELGEADAAIVYRTDAHPSPSPVNAGGAGPSRNELDRQKTSARVQIIPIPPAMNVLAVYVIGVVERTPNAELADAWIELVTSNAGRDILARHGFVVD